MVRTRSTSGAALVPALLVVSIVATAAATLGLSQQIWIRHVENLRLRSQADATIDGALAGACSVIALHRYDYATPKSVGSWTQPLSELSTPEANVSIHLASTQGKFNVNRLIAKDHDSPADRQIFERLLASVGLSPELADSVLDW